MRLEALVCEGDKERDGVKVLESVREEVIEPEKLPDRVLEAVTDGDLDADLLRVDVKVSEAVKLPVRDRVEESEGETVVERVRVGDTDVVTVRDDEIVFEVVTDALTVAERVPILD